MLFIFTNTWYKIVNHKIRTPKLVIIIISNKLYIHAFNNTDVSKKIDMEKR